MADATESKSLQIGEQPPMPEVRSHVSRSEKMEEEAVGARDALKSALKAAQKALDNLPEPEVNTRVASVKLRLAFVVGCLQNELDELDQKQ